MSGLSTLPHDIRYQVLTFLPDYRSICGLIITSRPFYTSFQQHRIYFFSRFLLKRYEPEANLIFSLSKIRGLPDTPEAWHSFRSAVGDYIDEKFEHFQIIHDKDADTLLSIARNHEAVFKSTNRFIRDQIYPHQPYGPKTPRNLSGAYPLPPALNVQTGVLPTPSINEYDSVVGGFYRLWIWTLLYGSRYYSGSDTFGRGKVRRYVDEMYDYILEAWGFWNVKNVQILVHWVIGWADFVIDEEGIGIPPATCDAIAGPDDERRPRGANSLLDPDHDRRDIIGSLIRHNLRGLLETTGDILSTKDIILDIINRSPFPLILTPLERGPGNYSPSCPGHLPSYATTITQSCIDLLEPRGIDPGEVEVRPVVSGAVRDRRAYEDDFRQDNRWMSMFIWLLGGVSVEPAFEGVDFWASVWDDWRLVGWGYWRPGF
ncbi:hypothetical protein TWF506_003237 [Arthrobotrys conoides]|uniref:Uncharacterized protein n=1 Tax=Arthrobotrys conoides TaxID=74498 RepID=A0AAN8P7Q4_9PEZI